MAKRSRATKADGPNGGQDITQMWAKAKQKKESVEATDEVVKATREMERDQSHVIKQYYENTFTAFTEAQKGGDVEDIQEDQHKLVDAVSSLAQQEGGGLPSKKLFTSILLCITENRSAKLSLRAYELLKKLQQKFPATKVLPGEELGQTLPYLQVDKEVWTPLDALPGSTPLRGTAAAASAPPPSRAGARPRPNADGAVGQPGDLFEVLGHIMEDLSDKGDAPASDVAPSQRGRKTKRQTDGTEVDEGAKHQARLEATEALAVQKLGSCLMFKYLVALLYDDLSCRLAVYRAHKCGTDLAILVNSMLYRLLVERRTKQQRDQIWSCIFAIIKAGALERAEEVYAPATAFTKSEGTDDMEIDAKNGEASGTSSAATGKKKKGKGRRSSTATVSQRGEEATPSRSSQVEDEAKAPFAAALQKQRDDTAAQHALSCSRQDLCTTAQTLLASMLELTAAMENRVNMWMANDTRKDLLERMVTEFNPNRFWDPRSDSQRHFLETMLSPEQKLRFIIEYFLAICPKGSEAVKVLQQKGRKATACDLLTSVRENVKKMLSSRHSTPDELSLLVAHAAQADLLLGAVNDDRLKQMKQELEEMRNSVGAPEKRGLPLSASSHAALVAASITARMIEVK